MCDRGFGRPQPDQAALVRSISLIAEHSIVTLCGSVSELRSFDGRQDSPLKARCNLIPLVNRRGAGMLQGDERGSWLQQRSRIA